MPPPYNSPDYQLMVINAPLHFLKQRIIKSHFNKFGLVSSVNINEEKRNCVVTFTNKESAELARKNCSNWKHYKLEIATIPINILDDSEDMEVDTNMLPHDDSNDPVSIEDEEVLELKKNYNTLFPIRSEDSNEPQKKKIHLTMEDSNKESSNKKLTQDSKQEDEQHGEELLSKIATTLNARLALLDERDKLLRIRMGRGDSNIKTASAIVGLCPDMCPEKERILRDARGIVAFYEVLDGTNTRMDHSKAVKDYARSSADQEEPLAHELRPEPVLTMTLDYLITQIMPKIESKGDNIGNWFDFLWYRLRSIRKDIIQQQLCDIKTVEIVEKCARFHICCFDRLWGASHSIFDDKINAETLMNCLQSLMHMYEDLRKQGTSCPDEPEFKAYLILLKLNSGFLLSEYQQYSSFLQNSPQVKDAVQIHTAYSNNMYSTFFRLMKKTSYLNSCLMQRFLAHLRTKALEIIVRAHCPPNKICRLPLNFIVQTLKFDSSKDCIHFCESFGLSLADDSYTFIISRNEFFFPESLFVIHTPSSIVVNKRVSVAQAVVGVNNKIPVYLPHQVHTSFNEDGTLKEGALDATDQEEKLYRDIVERKLNLREIDSKSVQDLEHMEIVEASSQTATKVREDDAQEQVESITVNVSSGDEENDSIQEGNLTTFAEEINEEDEQEEVDENDGDIKSEISLEDITESDSSETESKCGTDPTDTFISSNKCDKELVKEEESSTDKKRKLELTIKQPAIKHGPKSPKVVPEPVTFKFSNESSVLVTPSWQPPKLNVAPKSPITAISKSPIAKTLSATNFPFKIFKGSSAPSTPTWQPLHTPQWKSEKLSINKERNLEDKNILTKLKKIKQSEKMKKINIKKYAVKWRRKVEKMRNVSDKSLRDYFFYWGISNQSTINSKTGIRTRLWKKKKTALVVLSILNNDIVDRIDPETSRIGRILSDNLAKCAIDYARKMRNVSQPYPVFWKLVFALPLSLKGSFTFPDKLKNWCKIAFYNGVDKKLGDVQYRLSSLGVPTFISVKVVIGSKSFAENCSNISAAIVIRAHGWETKEDTQSRCEKLISVADSQFPLAILTLGEKFEPCSNLRHLNKLSYLHESLWNDTNKLVDTLLNLTRYTVFQPLKVDTLRSLIFIVSDKLFDSLHEDKFINDGLYDALCIPNNVIKFYNEIINKIEKELVICYEANYYGTACEFEQNVEKNYLNIVHFPTHYKDPDFPIILKKYLKNATLPSIKWPFDDSKELLTVFKDYCHNIGCDRILSKLIRAINPPDSNDPIHKLSDHLETINWLIIVEDLVKLILTQEIFQINVVFRENKIDEFIDSHWWMSSEIVTKTLTR